MRGRRLRSRLRSFFLLIDKAAGTRYENFSHEYVTKMSYAYEQYYAESRKRGREPGGGLLGAKVLNNHFHKAGMA